MKCFISIIFLIVGCSCNSQDNFKKNAVLFETGVWDRGLIGLSYTRNFKKNNLLQLAIGGGIGNGLYSVPQDIGLPVIYASQNFHLKSEIHLGQSKGKFLLGIQPQITLRKFESIFFNGPTYSTHLYTGIHILGDKGLTIQARLGVGHYLGLDFFPNIPFLPSIGFSFGHSF